MTPPAEQDAATYNVLGIIVKDYFQSFRDGRRPDPESRQALMRRWIPGSLASQAPRNDGAETAPE